MTLYAIYTMTTETEAVVSGYPFAYSRPKSREK